MTARKRACRIWTWFVTEKSQAHRLLAYLLVVGIGVMGFWDDYNDDKANEREARERRIVRSSQLYAGCLENNRQNERDDESFQTLAALSLSNPNANPERISRALDVLRDGLNQADCEVVFEGLTSEEVEQAKARAAVIPREPLPPPTVPGYIPPPNGTSTHD